MQNTNKYDREYNKSHRPQICTVRGTTADYKILVEAKEASRLTWLQILYRGLNKKRPKSL